MKILNPKYRADIRKYQAAADAGESYAMFNVALSHERVGNLTEAKRWYWKAAEAGDDAALGNLLDLLEANGHRELVADLEEAAGKASLAALRPLCDV